MRWFEAKTYYDKRAIAIITIVKFTQLTHCTQPTTITVNCEYEFIGHNFQKKLCKEEYGIDVKMAITTNPQANLLLKNAKMVQKRY